MTDPTDTWRAAFAASGQPLSAQLRETQTDFEDTLDDLKATQKALAASQADLTAMQTERDALAVLSAEQKASAAHWRAIARRHLASLDETTRALATANHENRRLKAELDSALGRLNEKEGKS